MRQMRTTRKLTLLGLALLLAACAPGQEPEPGEDSVGMVMEEAEEQSLSTSPYDMEVTFDGLIAFVEDVVDGKSSAWALLVKADYEGTPTADQLPPCVDPNRQHDFPSHKTYIRFPAGQVEKCNQAGGCAILADPQKGEPLPAGADLRFVTGASTTLSAALTPLASASELHITRRVSMSDAQALDELGVGVLSTPPTHPYLAARALLQAGTVESRPVACGAGGPPNFSFRSPTDTFTGCLAHQPTELAEATVWTQTGLGQPAIIDLGNGDEYRITSTGGTAKVEILNVVQKAFDEPTWNGCPKENEQPKRHLEAFRWFYRLAKKAPPADCADHYFPCELQGPFGGRKCPQKLFTE